MLNLILTLAMTNLTPAPKTAQQVQTCVWPHVCAEQKVETAQFQPCVWPNKCAETAQVVQTCVWPHVCAETQTKKS